MNATAKKVQDAPKESSVPTKAPETTMSVSKPAKEADAPKTPEKEEAKPNASTRIERLETLNKLAQRHDFLKHKAKELDLFRASNDGLKAHVSFVSSVGGEHVQVTNAQVIEKLVSVAGLELALLLGKCEDEINTFEI